MCFYIHKPLYLLSANEKILEEQLGNGNHFQTGLRSQKLNVLAV